MIFIAINQPVSMPRRTVSVMSDKIAYSKNGMDLEEIIELNLSMNGSINGI